MPEHSVLYKKETVSTMDDARNAVREGWGHGTVCRSDRQNAGRGRIVGRRWEDDGSGALLFTLILNRSSIQSSYPLTQLLALALCQRLENGYGLKPKIKWPNDVLLEDGKIAGILVETERNFFLAGMGINLLQRFFGRDMRRKPVSLALALSCRDTEALPPEEELEFLLDEIRKVLDSPPPLMELNDRLASRGETLSILLGDPSRNEIVTGIVMGLQEDGALILKTADSGLRAVYSGETVENQDSSR